MEYEFFKFYLIKRFINIQRSESLRPENHLLHYAHVQRKNSEKI